MIICLGTTPTVQRTMTFAKLAIDGVNRAKRVEEFASGKSVNAARVLMTLGERAVATGILGGDPGKFMRLDLDRAGIAHDFVECESPTRLCITLLDESNRAATELIEEARAVTSAVADALWTKLSTLIAHASVLVLSGSLAPGLGDDFYARCLQLAINANVKTLVDAVGQPLLHALAAKPTIVKPNRAELAMSTGMTIDSDDELIEAMNRVIAAGAKWIAITNGRAATMLSDGKNVWQIRTPGIQAINPIGSGDAFAAGLAAGIGRQMEMPQALRLAAACGVANALTPRAGHVNKSDVDAMFAQIDVVKIYTASRGR